MKNSVGFKIAVVMLCAAALLGTIFSAGGVLTLSEAGLYHRNVDDLRQEMTELLARQLAEEEARRYCAIYLGGCPEALADMHYPGTMDFNYDHVGFALKDEEGKLLAGNGRLTKQTSQKTYTIPVTGKYMYLVSAEPIHQGGSSEQNTQPEQPDAVVYTGSDGYYYSHTIPAEGSRVCRLLLESDTTNADMVVNGFVYTAADGSVYLRCERPFENELGTMYMVCLWDEAERNILKVTDPKGISGSSRCEEDLLILRIAPQFFHTAAEEVPEASQEAAAEPTMETIPETTAQTEATVSEEPVETTGETQASSASALPETEPAQLAETMPQEQTKPEQADSPEENVPLIDGKPLADYNMERATYDTEDGPMRAVYVYVPMPSITVEVYTEDGALYNEPVYEILEQVQPFRVLLIAGLVICVLLFMGLMGYLCKTAGHGEDTKKISVRGLNHIPLDVYLCVTGLAVLGTVGAVVVIFQTMLLKQMAAAIAMAAGICYVCCVLMVGLVFAAAAQFKAPHAYWWKNLMGVRLVRLVIRGLRWCWQRFLESVFPRMSKGMQAVLLRIAGVTNRVILSVDRVLSIFGNWMGRRLHSVLVLLPVTWQWLVVGALMILLPVFGLLLFHSLWIFWLCIVVDAALVFYGSRCFGTLVHSTQQMSKGNLNIQVDEKPMIGSFKGFAKALNNLAGVAMTAAKKQLRSDRMKTELIANVSHDIKTPLTSIINYVDLLQKPHTEQQQGEYLEVLARQSQRLKKLLDDLIELSKASTGNMAVELQIVDGVEAVNQALGEFTDKLESAQLSPLFRHSEESVFMLADGRLLWRVMSNLLSNAVKYAMPGTRLYIDLMQVDDQVVISMRNIARDQLNVDAEELMERFVRGDDARNTEGSGLGLNIARSLMELQHGQLELLVDGDLFKVTMIFPSAQ